MPVERHEIDHYSDEIWPPYRTLLGLFFDNPDTYYRAEEIIRYVDRPANIIELQLGLIRAAGPVEDFQVEVEYVEGEPYYGLAGVRRLDSEQTDPSTTIDPLQRALEHVEQSLIAADA